MVPHVPERTCVGCRGRATKDELVRVVRGSAGEAELDRTGSAPGRGAYVHRRLECMDEAFVRGSLSRALRTSVSKERAATLRADIEEEPRA
ncbi:MAG TPA: YlxR family protein [Actinomycetota bacterium]|nr:YlxR family protein [Actinomycetota bacterium]